MNLALLLGMIGPWQVVLIVLGILLMFGGKKIPELMRGLGKGMSEFKKGKEEGNEKKEDYCPCPVSIRVDIQTLNIQL